MADIRFQIFKEKKDKTTGKSTFNDVVASIGPINIEEVSVTTQAEKQIVKEGNQPTIIPYGVKGQDGRVAQIVGTIKGKSMEYQQNIDSYFDVLQANETLGYALSIDAGNSEIPELGPKTARWGIKQFVWDRQAKLLGQWKFNITLNYIWDSAINEIQLYAKNTDFEIPDNVKFRALKGIANGGYNSGQEIINPKIKTSIHQLNTATFSTKTKAFDKGDVIHIYCETDPSNAVFFGIIRETPSNSNMYYTYDCIEIGALLDRVQCSKVGPGLFKPRMKIPNPYKGKNLKLEQFVALILNFYKESMLEGYDPKYGKDMTSKWGKEEFMPYDPTVSSKQVIPAQVLSGMTVFKALIRLLEDQCGMYIWFDNNNGALEYGFLRNKFTIDPTRDIIRTSSLAISNSEDYTPNNVILYNSTGDWVVYPNPPVNGTFISYQYNSTLNNIMMDSMAKKIHKDLQSDRTTYKVVFPAGRVKFRDGDVFTGLGDSTISPVMPYRDDTDYDPLTDTNDTVWQIKDMTITTDYTEILVGPSYFSVFDLFKSTLKIVPEAPIPTEFVEKETNQVALATQATNITHTINV